MKIDKKGFTEYDENVLRLCEDYHIDRKEGEHLYTGKVYAKTMKRDERTMELL